MADVEEKYCTNCKRHIAAVNFVMHEVHCKRNIVLCEQCKEPVPRSELDNHIEEEHATSACTLCGEDVEKSKADEHTKNCSKRPMKCPYCELELPFSDLLEHEEYCGSRTEACLLCGQFVMLKDMIQHEQSGCSYPNAPQTSTSVLNNTRPAANRREQHDVPRGTAGLDELPSYYNSFAMDEISRILNVDLPIRNDTRAESMSSRDVNINDRLQFNGPASNVSHRAHRAPLRGPTNKANKSKRTNEVAARKNKNTESSTEQRTSTQIGSDLDHLLAMHLAHDINESSDDIENIPHLPADVNQMASSYSNIQRSSPTPLDDFSDDVCLPCEFCGELLPSYSLIQHQGFCNPVGSGEPLEHSGVNVNNFFTAPADVGNDDDHIINRAMRRLSESQDQNIEMNNSRGQSRITDALTSPPQILDNLSLTTNNDWLSNPADTDDEILLPCEFCDELISQDFLLQHQATCDVYNTVFSTSPTFDEPPRRPNQSPTRTPSSPLRANAYVNSLATAGLTRTTNLPYKNNMNRNLPKTQSTKSTPTPPGARSNNQPNNNITKVNSQQNRSALIRKYGRNRDNMDRLEAAKRGSEVDRAETRRYRGTTDRFESRRNPTHAVQGGSRGHYEFDDRENQNGTQTDSRSNDTVVPSGAGNRRRSSQGMTRGLSNNHDLAEGFDEVDILPANRRQNNSAHVRRTLDSLIKDPSCTTDDLLAHLDKEEKTRYNSVTVMKDNRPDIRTGNRRNVHNIRSRGIDNGSAEPYEASFANPPRRPTKQRGVERSVVSPDLQVGNAPLHSRRNVNSSEKSVPSKQKKSTTRQRRTKEE